MNYVFIFWAFLSVVEWWLCIWWKRFAFKTYKGRFFENRYFVSDRLSSIVSKEIRLPRAYGLKDVHHRTMFDKVCSIIGDIRFVRHRLQAINDMQAPTVCNRKFDWDANVWIWLVEGNRMQMLHLIPFSCDCRASEWWESLAIYTIAHLFYGLFLCFIIYFFGMTSGQKMITYLH